MRLGPQKYLPRSTGIESMGDNRNPRSVEAKPALSRVEWVSAAILGRAQAARLPLQRCDTTGFTLAELVVTVGVLVLLVFLATQVLKSSATITTLGHKQMDADAQARQLLDRMAIDFAQLAKRTDLDLFAKGTVAPNSV